MTTTTTIHGDSSSMTETPSSTYTIRLSGCAPTPMAHYLKALAVLRIVAEQADSEVRGRWDEDDFIIESKLDEEALIHFFATEYQPMPIASPWNGGSGFKPEKISDEVTAIRHSKAGRMASYRDVIEAVFELLDHMNIEGKVPKDRKELFLKACRSRLPERALAWLDATYVMTNDGPSYPAVLGSGGNDGRLEFGLNFMARLQTLFDFETGEPASESPSLLRASLFSRAHHNLQTGNAIGQFFPQAVGGPNQTTGFSADTVSNPWDYVLMLEGAVFFAAAAVKRLESGGSSSLSVPFSVRHVGVGQGSADSSEESDARDELWIPLWSKFVTARELHALMAEGRARVGRRTARDGVDFARAVATLGVDRGISEFQRYGFQQRNGRAFFATPLNRIAVEHRPNVDLIDDIDHWFNRVTNAARYDDTAPDSIKSAARNLEEAIFRLCELDDSTRVRDVITCLGACERQLARSHEWAHQSGVRPLSGLSGKWLEAGYDGSREFRLAASLASVCCYYDSRPYSIRNQLEPVEHRYGGRYRWRDQPGRDVVWHDGDPIDVIGRIMSRRILHATKKDVDHWPDTGRIKASLHDVAAFVDGLVDFHRLTDLMWGLVGVDWRNAPRSPFKLPYNDDVHPGALFALTKLCFPGVVNKRADADGEEPSDELAEVRLVPKIHRHLRNGAGHNASVEASRRLRADHLRPAIGQLNVDGKPVQRCAAALIFPLRREDLRHLQQLILKPQEESNP